MKKLIYSKEDLDLILSLENEEKDKEIERLNNIIKNTIKEIERLNKELETLKQPQVFIDTQDMEERYGEDLYKEYLEKENKRLNNIINELERYINEEYIYDELGMKIFDASKLQDKLQELKGSDKEW